MPDPEQHPTDRPTPLEQLGLVPGDLHWVVWRAMAVVAEGDDIARLKRLLAAAEHDQQPDPNLEALRGL